MSETKGTSTTKKTSKFETITSQWEKVISTVGGNPVNRPLVTNGFPVEMRGGSFVLGFDEDLGFMRDIAARKSQVLEEGIERATGIKVRVRCIVAHPSQSAIPFPLRDMVQQASAIFEPGDEPADTFVDPPTKTLSAAGKTAWQLSVLDSDGGIPDTPVSYAAAVLAVLRYARLSASIKDMEQGLEEHRDQCGKVLEDGQTFEAWHEVVPEELAEARREGAETARLIIRFIEHPSDLSLEDTARRDEERRTRKSENLFAELEF